MRHRILRIGLVLTAAAALFAAGASAEEKGGTPGKLKFKSRVINAPEMSSQVKGVVADAFREAYRDKSGKSKKLNAKEEREFLGRLERAFRLNRSSEGLQSTQTSNGTFLDLQGRYQYIFLSRTNADGSVSTACVNDWETAQAFLQGSGGSATE